MFRWRKVASSLLIFSICFAASGYASDAASLDEPITVGGEILLDKVVLLINEGLHAKYALLDPPPLTVGRFREAVKAKIEMLSKRDERDRTRLVKALQRILAEKRLPDRFSFHLTSTSAKYKKDSLDDDVLDKQVVNLSYNLSVPVSVGKETTRTVRLTSLNEKFFIVRKGKVVSGQTQPSQYYLQDDIRYFSQGPELQVEPPSSSETPASRSGFLQAGKWWNLYFDEGNDPLNRSVRAVKVVQLSRKHSSWVQIAFPEDRDEHFSIFRPAARAHNDDAIDLADALAQWEKEVTKWKTIWINLDFVVQITKVAQYDEHESE